MKATLNGGYSEAKKKRKRMKISLSSTVWNFLINKNKQSKQFCAGCVGWNLCLVNLNLFNEDSKFMDKMDSTWLKLS